NDLLFELLLHRDVPNRNDYAAGFAFGIEQRTGVRAHGAPVAIAMPRPELAEAKLLGPGTYIVIQQEKFGRLFLLGVVHSLAQQIGRSTAQQIANAGTDKAVPPLQIDHQ